MDGSIYQFHGLSVDCIDNHKPPSEKLRHTMWILRLVQIMNLL